MKSFSLVGVFAFVAVTKAASLPHSNEATHLYHRRDANVTLPPGPINEAIYTASNESVPYLNAIVEAVQSGQAQYTTVQVVDQNLQNLTALMNTLTGEIKGIQRFHIGIVVQPVHDSLIELVQGWVKVINALYNDPSRNQLVPLIQPYLQPWATADVGVLKQLNQSLVNESQLTKQAAADAGLTRQEVDTLGLAQFHGWLVA